MTARAGLDPPLLGRQPAVELRQVAELAAVGVALTPGLVVLVIADAGVPERRFSHAAKLLL